VFKRYIWAIVFLLFSQLAIAGAPDNLKGALCLIKTDKNQIVLVREAITNKLSLPGGTIEKGEEPQLAAQRETWEETGLVVTVGKPLGYSNKAVIFDCLSDSEVVAFSHANSQGQYTLPAWFAPHYGVETREVVLSYLEALEPSDYRYPLQVADVINFAELASPQAVTYIDQAIQAAPSIHQSELASIKLLQENVRSFPGHAFTLFDGLLKAVNSLAAPWLLMLVVPLMYLTFGRDFGAKLMFAVMSVALLGLVAQIGLGMARPHVYMPELQLAPSYGFGMPSVSSALIVTVLGLVYLQMEKVNGVHATRRFLSVFITTVLLHGLASVYLGSQFFSGMVAGIVLGILVVWHFVRLNKKIHQKLDAILTSAGVWWLSVAAIAGVGTLWPRPELAYWLAISISLAAVFTFLKPRCNVLATTTKDKAVIMGLLVAIQLLFVALRPLVDSSSMSSLILQTVNYSALVLAFACSVLVIEKRRAENK